MILEKTAVPEGLPEPPVGIMGLMGHKRGAHQPTRGGAPSFRQEAELEKEEGVRPSLFLVGLGEEGERGGGEEGKGGAAPLSLSYSD